MLPAIAIIIPTIIQILEDEGGGLSPAGEVDRFGAVFEAGSVLVIGVDSVIDSEVGSGVVAGDGVVVGEGSTVGYGSAVGERGKAATRNCCSGNHVDFLNPASTAWTLQ